MTSLAETFEIVVELVVVLGVGLCLLSGSEDESNLQAPSGMSSLEFGVEFLSTLFSLLPLGGVFAGLLLRFILSREVSSEFLNLSEKVFILRVF